MTSSDPLPPRDRLIGAKYRLGREVGVGGVATVYQATHIWTEREVAVKVLDSTLPHFDQLREGFLQEARATVQLDHPNVVDILDMGQDDPETVFLVMELIEGFTLRELLTAQGPLSSEDTGAVLRPLMDALEKAHELGIVHRDFKPENIMLSADSNGRLVPKLLDFGVAAILRDFGSRGPSGTHDLIVGTPEYMAPEQVSNDRAHIGPQTDVWGVGVVWYECLTGRCPFGGETSEEILHAVWNDPIDFAGLPEAFVPVLKDALIRHPELRTRTMSAMRDQLDALDGGVWSAPSAEPDGEPSGRAVHHTLHGFGPTETLPAAAIATPDASEESEAADPEWPELPERTSRKGAWMGIAVGLAAAVAIWWAVRVEDVRTPAPSEPTAEGTAPPSSDFEEYASTAAAS
ncbi:MAG: serine/threonine-protein kinase, partial [Polyangiales bacterium]